MNKKNKKIDSERIIFSFKYLDKQHKLFSKIFEEKSEYQTAYFLALFVRLKDLISINRSELREQQMQQPKTWRFHSIDWNETSQKKGFGLPNEGDLVDTPYQISVSANEYGRVVGFFIQSTFYIVWLDHKHLLYPDK